MWLELTSHRVPLRGGASALPGFVNGIDGSQRALALQLGLLLVLSPDDVAPLRAREGGGF